MLEIKFEQYIYIYIPSYLFFVYFYRELIERNIFRKCKNQKPTFNHIVCFLWLVAVILLIIFVSTRRSGPTFGLVAKKVSNFEKTFNCLPLFAPDICFLSFSNLYFCLNFFTLFTTSRAVKPVQLNLPNLFKKFSNGERLLSVWTVYKHMHVIIPVSHIMYINIYYTYQNNIQLQVLSTSLLTFCSFATAFGSFYRPDSQLNSSWRNLAIPDHDFLYFFLFLLKFLRFLLYRHVGNNLRNSTREVGRARK